MSKCVTFAEIPVPAPLYHQRIPMLAMTLAPQPQPAAPAPALDDASLQRLHELDPQGANRVVERVLQAFEASLNRLLPQARQALQQGDEEALRHVVHTLKSSSASVGALQLSQHCAEIESRLRLQQAAGLAERIDALVAEGERVLAAVRCLLSE
jgi:HPt (histidine-containing phosphotransfer) domain-containing protein